MNARLSKALGLGLLLLSINGCSNSEPAIHANGPRLRPLNEQERIADFEIMAQNFRELYGPLEYKEKRFGFSLDTLVQEYRDKAIGAKSDQEFSGVLHEFITRFQDGHVSLGGGVEKIKSYTVPLFLTPIEGRAIISNILDESLAAELGIAVGDEVTEIDGQTPQSFIPVIRKYGSLGNEISDQHLIYQALRRKAYITELVPQSPTVRIKFSKPDGQTLERTLIWKIEDSDSYAKSNFVTLDPRRNAYSEKAAEVVRGTMYQFGDELPFYYSEKKANEFGFVRVYPSEAALKKHGLKEDAKVPDLFAAKYRYEGKNILLIRIATYWAKDLDARFAWYKAVLSENKDFVDALVIDQTHNPGGSLGYARNIVSLFADQKTHNVVNFLNADRRWMDSFVSWIEELSLKGEELNVTNLAFKLVEDAYDKGLRLTERPVSLDGYDYITPASVTFNKPIVFLADELSGSCGDIVPMLMKNNKLATIFGKRTMGLGGNVEEVITLPYSQTKLNLTRGFFAPFSPENSYDLVNPVENNGVTPDIAYEHTVADFRAGYTDYIKAFSKVAADLAK